jgi:hypothetical protein
MRNLASVHIQPSSDTHNYTCTRTFKDHDSGEKITQEGSLHPRIATLQWNNTSDDEKIQHMIQLKQYEQKAKRTIYGTLVTEKYIYNITVDSDDHKIADENIEDISNILQRQHLVVRLSTD